ncbi:MAG TPA: hypothetical protein PKI61_00115 [bacterium]|nr:hypothetical protein [bacterium]HPT29454.1 hypothetical protein [bacterium]
MKKLFFRLLLVSFISFLIVLASPLAAEAFDWPKWPMGIHIAGLLFFLVPTLIFYNLSLRVVLHDQPNRIVFVREAGRVSELKKASLKCRRREFYYLGVDCLAEKTGSFEFPMIKSPLLNIKVKGRVFFTLEQTRDFEPEELVPYFDRGCSLTEIIQESLLEANRHLQMLVLERIHQEMVAYSWSESNSLEKYSPQLIDIPLRPVNPLTNIQLKKAWLEISA